MTPLQKLKAWLATYPGYDILGTLHVDYTDNTPCGSGLFPGGVVEMERSEDLIGGVTVSNQLNFALYCTFEKPAGDNAEATVNADWVMDFQQWVQEQSIRRRSPVFGTVDTDTETIKAQNGAIYETNNEGVGIYLVQLSITYKLYYEE